MYNKIKSLEDTNTIVICNSSNVSNYKKAIPYGYTEEEISHNIFKILREIDKKRSIISNNRGRQRRRTRTSNNE